VDQGADWPTRRDGCPAPKRLRLALSRRPDPLSLVERLHRLLLDVIKDEFERLGLLDVNAVQALLLFNVGDNEVTAGELKSRGYYQGSNVSYNLKKLVEMGYMHHQRCEIDRRSVRVRLTSKGREIRDIVAEGALRSRHAEGLERRARSVIERRRDGRHRPRASVTASAR
jgi:DNA-binding MarR family transcriptional regulator